MNRLASDQAQLYEFVAPQAGKAGEKEIAREQANFSSRAGNSAAKNILKTLASEPVRTLRAD